MALKELKKKSRQISAYIEEVNPDELVRNETFTEKRLI